MIRSLCALVLLACTAPAAFAQPLGAFRWQLQPYCNVLTMTVSQNGSVYALDGYDDQCGSGTRAPLTGTAVPNPDGTVALGINIVTSPSAAPVHVAVPLNPATLAGTWQDDAGHSGAFVFTPGEGAAGLPRPMPSASLIPSSILLQPDGGFLAGGSENSGVIPASGAGVRMMWHPNKAAFRVGLVEDTSWDDANVGRYSMATGRNTLASGPFSVALGQGSIASGFASMAFGQNAKASGGYSVATGDGTTAAGAQSTAMGMESTASGEQSFAAGRNAKALGHTSIAMGADAAANGTSAVAIGRTLDVGASGVAIGSNLSAGFRSVALGYHAVASHAGAIVIGDSSDAADADLISTATNQFSVRAAGGYRLFSSPFRTAGVTLASGGSAWASVSDVKMKENFRDLDDADILAKIARMPIREWNYKAQDAAIRHVGPTAQDFHAAFGLGEDPLRISTIDADGIALASVKALAVENQALKAALAALSERLERLETSRR